ncbi:MAG: sigma-70 family RNA polymerase sigma factor [Ktedonobacteraceae bacterium]|nr:sigma-70 family RNA polymerase sigma factor [Ktedonobacteraceae bacterium]
MKGHVPYTREYASPTSRLTKEEEQAYIERARTGGEQEHHAFLLSFRGYIHRQAVRYVRQWNSPRIEYDDLVQEGSLAATTHLEQALAHETPYPYLRKVVVKAITDYCYEHITPIKKPRQHRSKGSFRTIPVVSLDALLSAESSTRDLDLLSRTATSAQRDDYVLLHRAIDQLPGRQREVIKRHFGFEGIPETLYCINQSLQTQSPTKRATKAYTYQRKALGRLRTQLPALAGMTPDQIRERHIGTLPFHPWEVPL